MVVGLTPAHTADKAAAPAFIEGSPQEPRNLLRDRHRNTPNVRQVCASGLHLASNGSRLRL
jgi:hypothetical protein